MAIYLHLVDLHLTILKKTSNWTTFFHTSTGEIVIPSNFTSGPGNFGTGSRSIHGPFQLIVTHQIICKTNINQYMSCIYLPCPQWNASRLSSSGLEPTIRMATLITLILWKTQYRFMSIFGNRCECWMVANILYSTTSSNWLYKNIVHVSVMNGRVEMKLRLFLRASSSRGAHHITFGNPKTSAPSNLLNLPCMLLQAL